jgi:type II secretory pathway component PulF
MWFAYEAMRSDGSLVADRLEAGSHGEAAEHLRGRGLIVMHLAQHAEPDVARGGGVVGWRSAAVGSKYATWCSSRGR